MSNDNSLTRKLWTNGDAMKVHLSKLGFDIGHSETPITPLMIGDEALTILYAQKLLERGIFVSPIVFPTVPLGSARIRIMLSAAHSFADIEKASTIFGEVAREIKII